MDYQVSARKYRPGSFESVIGQPHVVQTLVNAIGSKRIAHAFLFSGTRGVGKTTVARILAKALNCERGPTGTPCETCDNCREIAQGTSVDVVEIDGASNTSVDDVREIRENVKFAPFRGSYRVYIIDEVHMLSNSAFNALLKTLEEPPSHVVFIFATTEIHKIPATILSRCQHYNFRRISKAEIIERLRHVAQEEGLALEDRSFAALARASEGSMRDALSLLDQAVAFGGKTLRHQDLETLLGAVPQEQVRAMAEAIRGQDGAAAVQVVAQLLDQGHDLRAYCAELVEHVRNLLVASIVPGQDPQALHGLIDLSEEEIRQIATEAKAFPSDQLQELLRIFSQAEDHLRSASHPRFVMEAAAIRACSPKAAASPATVASSSRAASAPAPGGKPTSRENQPPPYATRMSPPGPPKAPPAEPPRAAPPKPAGTAFPQRPAPAAGAQPNRQPPPAGPTGGPPKDHGVPTSAKPSPAPSAPAKSSSASPAQAAPAGPAIELNWEQLLERIEQDHPSIAPFLAQGRLVSIEGTRVTMGYPKASVAFTRINTDAARKTISDVCSELTGKPVQLSVVELAEGQAAAPSMAQSRIVREREQKQALMDRARANPLVKQALTTFGGDLTEVRQVAPQKETDA